MRQVFTSQRLETVEGVARMLEEAGIAVHVSQPRSYHSRRSGQFSYSDPTPARQQPAVWVRVAEDQPRARELLRQSRRRVGQDAAGGGDLNDVGARANLKAHGAAAVLRLLLRDGGLGGRARDGGALEGRSDQPSEPHACD